MKFKGLIIAGIILIQLFSVVSALTISSVSSNPTEVAPGEEVRLIIEIENNLGEDVENVVVSLDLEDSPFAPYRCSSQVIIEEIDDDDEEDAKFDLITNSGAKSGVYKIPVKISYGDDDESEGLISLIINAKPELYISIEDGMLIKGRNNELIIKIVNSGLGDAGFLSLKLGSILGIKILGSDNTYIGNIDSDDFDTAEFDISINENVQSSISLPVEITYRNSRNEEITENKNLVLKIYSEEEAIELGLIKKNNSLIYVGVGMILILSYVVYRNVKKRKRKKKRLGG
ncbi:hypothetical protein KAT24_00355 [Candidatus Pacearchaeota archaeon]|nr:hypothetical protein [Candidatus Pacearchaeota archaeon]